jgi:hypothetical protein
VANGRLEHIAEKLVERNAESQEALRILETASKKTKLKGILGTYIRKTAANLPLGIRLGESAVVDGKTVVTRPGGPETECYSLRYSDGATALLPISAVEPGEFIPNSD